MKLIPTNTGLTGLKWEYSSTQINTNDIRQIRFAVYDNAPDIGHCFEKKRYRCEVQIWTGEQRDADYKLFNWMSNYKTYKNCQWKEENDPFRDWYEKEVDFAKGLNEQYGAQAIVAHANLGFPKHHSGRDDGSYGFYNQPQYAFHLLATDDTVIANVSVENYKFQEELTENKIINGPARVHWRKFDVR